MARSRPAFPDEGDARLLSLPLDRLPGSGLRRIGDHFRLPLREFDELVAFVFWPVDRPDAWTCARHMLLGHDAWALGAMDGEALVITRTPAAWLARPDSTCILSRDPKQIGVDLLAAGRALAFLNHADAAWAWACLRAVTMPAPPAMFVEAA